jgi:hypothetical protein
LALASNNFKAIGDDISTRHELAKGDSLLQ